MKSQRNLDCVSALTIGFWPLNVHILLELNRLLYWIVIHALVHNSTLNNSLANFIKQLCGVGVVLVKLDV